MKKNLLVLLLVPAFITAADTPIAHNLVGYATLFDYGFLVREADKPESEWKPIPLPPFIIEANPTLRTEFARQREKHNKIIMNTAKTAALCALAAAGSIYLYRSLTK